MHTTKFFSFQAAMQVAVELTNNPTVSFAGDFGQDEAKGEVGMGNDNYAIVVFPDGSAELTM